MDKNLQILEHLATLVETQSAVGDFVKAFEKVLDIFASMKADNTAERAQIQAQIEQALQTIAHKLAQVKDGKDGKDGAPGTNGKDGENADPADVVPLVLAQLPKTEPPTGNDHINLINHKDTNTRIRKDRIEGLLELEARLNNKAAGAVFVQSRGAVKAYDLSSKLDGSTATFNLPAFWRVISVHLSSTPNVLRETTDYTTDAANMQITFTSQINPATILAAGQTCIIVYAEP